MERAPLRTWFRVWGALKNLLGGSSLVMTSSICWRNILRKIPAGFGTSTDGSNEDPARNLGFEPD